VISVIIPVFNDPDGLNDTLESLLLQDFPKNEYEIIIVDNGSTDNTRNVGNEFSKKYPLLTTLLIEDKIRSSYAARNKGIAVARGELISFIDADITVRYDWLRNIREIFDRKHIDCLGCNVRLYSTRKSIASLYNLLRDFTIKSDIEEAHYIPTCCLTVRREVFNKIGLFDSRLRSGGDWEFGNRAWNDNIIFHYAGNITIYHPARNTIISLLRKSMRIGRGGRGQLSCLYPKRYGYFNKIYLSWRHLVPRNPYSIRSQYKCGYSFKTTTVIFFSFFPVVSHIFSLIGFLWAKMEVNFNK
jgi:glycosyltransferase involved in cell wall biosynthesis